MNRSLRLVAEYARDHGPAAVADAARRLLEPPRKAMTARAIRKREKREAREERNARMAAMRAEVFEKSTGTCVACGWPIYIDSFHAHHLISGVGARQVSERLDTLAPVCPSCHRLAHAGYRVTLKMLAIWCVEKGYAEAARALAKRIAKADSTERMLARGGHGG